MQLSLQDVYLHNTYVLYIYRISIQLLWSRLQPTEYAYTVYFQNGGAGTFACAPGLRVHPQKPSTDEL